MLAHSTRLFCAAPSCAVGALLGFLSAFAQASNEGAAGGDALGLVETIIVSGQRSYYDKNASSAARVELPVLETPQSIFVINADLIADQQAFRFDQILQNDSSVQKVNNFLGAYSSFAIRGFSLDNRSNYFRDGRSFFHLASPPVEVVDRVEVLKGPASVLYGTVAPGGIINMIPKRPQSQRETSFRATGGSYDFYHAHLDHGGPLTADGRVRYRINAAYEDSGSYREFVDGSDFDTERVILSGALDWDIGSHTTLRFNADYTDDERPQDIGIVSLTGDFSGVDTDLIINQPWSRYDSEVYNFFVELNHEFSDHLQLRVGASHQEFVRDRYDNQFRGLPSEAGDINIRARRRVNDRDYTTYFADLIGEFDTGSISHLVLVGVDKTDVDITNNETTRNFTFPTNIFAPEIIDDPQILPSEDAIHESEDRLGLTFQDVMSIGDHWRVLIGGRFDDYEYNSSFEAFSTEASHFTPRFGVVYLPAPNLSLYASYSESFEPNGTVDVAFDNAGEELDPTIGEQLEVGVKWEAFGGNLLATAAAFEIERSDSPVVDTVTNRVVQRGRAEHRGAEFTVTGLAGDNITLHGAATYLDAEIVEDDNPALIGNAPSGVADWSLSFTGEYEFLEGALAGLSLQAGVFYESDRPVDDGNSYDLGSYTRIDLGLKYLWQLQGRDLIFRLTAQNLTDELYFKAPGPLAVNPERPREIRASVELKF